MKQITKVTATLAVVLVLLISASPVWALTTDMELVGEAAGLILAPAGGKLFDLRNINPGDTRQATLKIRNGYSKWYDLWMRAEDITAEEPSLFEVMELTVTYRDKEIYRGPVAGFARGTIYLGRFRPGESGELAVTVHLPGLETGNEFQGKSAGVKWVFTAQSSGEKPVEPGPPGILPDLPRTAGERIPCFYFLLGGLALLAGTQLSRKRDKGTGSLSHPLQ